MNALGLVALCTLVPLLFAPPGLAHGGQYRGPGDVVPPGGRGPTTGPEGPGGPGPRTPGSPRAPGAPVTPGSTTPGGGPPPGPGGRPPVSGGRRGAEPGDDLTQWEFWWEFNKDPYLRLADTVGDAPVTGSADLWLGGGMRHGDARDTLHPTRDQVRNDILPALKKAIDATDNRDIATSCMIAMAKTGVDHPQFQLVDVFASHLQGSDQEVRETAALALGIAGIAGEREVTLLEGLAKDGDAGRKACGRDHVEVRTRTFALYGLGLMAQRTTKADLRRRLFETLRSVLETDDSPQRDLRVAAIAALGLFAGDRGVATTDTLVDDVVVCLERYWGKDLGVGERLVQAHCPPAIAKLLGRRSPRSQEFARRFATELRCEDGTRDRGPDLARSYAIALGMLAQPDDAPGAAKAQDAEIRELLLTAHRGHADAQTRGFAAIALGEIGGRRCRDALLEQLAKGKTQLRPWVALGLGVLAWRDLEAQRAAGGSGVPDAAIGGMLLEAFRDAKAPSQVGALAIALGLCHWQDAGPQLVAHLRDVLAQEELAGHLCIGLALMDDRRALPDLRQTLLQATRRPVLMLHAAVALGHLGDKQAADDLQRLLAEADTNLARLAAVAGALGHIGDRRSIAPLQRLLADQGLGELTRAFAAVALGGIADREPLRWNSRFAVDTNYRAAVGTLTDGQTGILDLL